MGPNLKEIFVNSNTSNTKSIVFVPGGPWINGEYWDYYLKSYWRNSNSYRYVLPNHEESYSPFLSLDLPDVVADFATQINYLLGLNREVILVSHSYGAWLSLALPSEVLNKVKKIVCVSMPLTLRNVALEEKIAELVTPRKLITNEDFRKFFSDILKLYFTKSFNFTNYSFLSSSVFMEGNEKMLFKRVDHLVDKKLRNYPVSFIYGDDDKIVGQLSIDLDDKYLILGSGHFPMIDQPEKFTEILQKIIT